MESGGRLLGRRRNAGGMIFFGINQDPQTKITEISEIPFHSHVTPVDV
jgi:hypothetical protein